MHNSVPLIIQTKEDENTNKNENSKTKYHKKFVFM